MNRKKIAINTGLSVILVATAVEGVRTIGNPSQPKPVEQTAIANTGTVATTVSATGNLDAPKTLGLVFAGASPGLVTAVNVKIGDEVKEGAALAKVDDRAANNQLGAADAALLTAKAQLIEAKETLHVNRNQLAAAVQTFRNAKLAVHEAKQLFGLDTGTQQALVEAAERELAAARHDVAFSRSRSRTNTRDHTHTNTVQTAVTPPSPPSPATTTTTDAHSDDHSEQSQGSITASTSRSAVAGAGSGVVSSEVNRSRQLLTDHQTVLTNIAQAQLELRNVGIAAATNGIDHRYGTPGLLASAKAAVANANVLIAEAKTALDDTTLKAPIDGTIVYVAGSVGETPASAPRGTTAVSATPNGPGSVEDRDAATQSGFVIMADMTHREVTAQVDEADIGKIKAGQKATVTFPATGGQVTGIVGQQDVQETVINNVVEYNVKIDLDGNAAAEKLGQSASVVITTAEKDNVLEVPNNAIRPTGNNQAVVTVKRGKDYVTVPVTPGLVGDTNTEVSSPMLKPGDVVVLPTPGAKGGRLNLPGRGKGSGTKGSLQ
jgi:multidrug efflux pump subunit AcrA (membrane-fusion protein)